MNSGKLDQRVTIKRLTITADGQGGGAETWTTIATVWANVRPKSGRERAGSDQLMSTGNYIITIRYLDDLSESDRIVWGAKEFNIRFIADAGGRESFMQIDCNRVVP